MVNEILVSGGWPKSSKYHGQIGEYVYKMVQNAQHEILISCYYFRDNYLAEHIAIKAEDELRIRIILGDYTETRKVDGTLYRAANSKNNDFNLYCYDKRGRKEESLLHTKLIVTDSTYNYARACVGSANLTPTAFNDSVELSIGITGKTAMELGEMFRKELLKSTMIKDVK